MGVHLDMFRGIQCPLIDTFSYRAMVSVCASCKGKAFDVSNIQSSIFMSLQMENSHQVIITEWVNDITSDISVIIYKRTF